MGKSAVVCHVQPIRREIAVSWGRGTDCGGLAGNQWHSLVRPPHLAMGCQTWWDAVAAKPGLAQDRTSATPKKKNDPRKQSHQKAIEQLLRLGN